MPELPEVETTRRGIEPYLLGRRVTAVDVRQPSLRWPVSDHLGQAVAGHEVIKVTRRAKYLFLETTAGRIMIHLGMSGSLTVVDIDSPVRAHDHIDFLLDSGKMLRYRDPRRFGSVFWISAGDSHVLLDSLGPEPLSDEFSVEYLFSKSRGKSVAIKNFVMNGHVVVGVGNIYANEALYRAGIRPTRAAGSVSRIRHGKLVASIKQVLTRAIEAGGTTLRDFVREDGSPGYFSQALQVYGRAGQPCLTCQRPLKEVRLGQRTTVYCSRCQR